MPSYSSYTHVVGSRTFTVMEHTNDQTIINGIVTGVAQAWRTVQDGKTGEIVREFRPPPNVYGLSPYDFTEGQRWLEARYGMDEQIAKVKAEMHAYEREREKHVWAAAHPPKVAVNYGSIGGNITISNSSTNISAYIAPNYVTASSGAGQAHDKEEDMAQRHEFLFDYTGQEIADALSRQITELTDSITALDSLDEAALALIYNIETDRSASQVAQRKRKELATRVEKLVKERAPYAKAATQTFQLDLEDVEHFRLDDETPREAKPKRKRRTKAEIEAATAGTAA